MKKRRFMSGTALTLVSAMALQTVDWSALRVLAESNNNVDEDLAYFVDCGDYDVNTLSEGDLFGKYNRVTDQAYGADAVTGKKWGIVDTVSTPLANGSLTDSAMSNAVFTDWTWPYEYNTPDGSDKTLTNRYTKNQFETGKDRNLKYDFEVPNGTYTVEVCFADPWGCSTNPVVSLEGQTAMSEIITGVPSKALVNVTDGILNMDVKSENACINMAYIKVYFGDKTAVEDETPGNEEENNYIKGFSSYDLGQVNVTDAYLENAEAKDIEYLLSLDSDKLLAGFRETAGLDMNGATRYGGWEDSLIGSHTMGHYLTAVAQAVATLPDTDSRKAQLSEKLEYIVAGLAECQEAYGNGYIFGATLLSQTNVELQFDNVEQGKANIVTQAWVPWYTMHKILSGIIDVYKYTGNEKALEVAKNLGTWVYNRTSKWDTTTKNRVLSIEYGGMNDCLYELYAVTGEDKFAVAAHAFDEDGLFKSVNAGSANVLANKHANTTIPKFIGALNRYITTNGKTIGGEVVDAEVYLQYAENFFTMVTERHTYITGDNSEWEHFGADNILDAERTNCNCETCNAYNMMKFAKALYMVTGKEKYLNYYETAFYNTILSSQNPETGMTTYFQPMASGYFKVYGTEFDSFWCCTGSGMENFTKLGNAIYYYNNDMVIVSQYLSSVLTDAEKNLKITQTANIPTSNIVEFKVNTLDNTETIASKVAFRLPEWLADDAVVSVNGNEVAATVESGYAIVDGLKNNDVIKVTLPMKLNAYNLPDGENVYAFKYGPIVLSAKLGTENMQTTITGVDVKIPAAKLIGEAYISDGSETVSVLTGSVSDFMKDINTNLVKTEGKLEWTLENTDANLVFVPHYSQHTERYGIYFNYISNTDAFNATKYIRDKAQERFQAALLDTMQPGYGQYEKGMIDNGSFGYTDNGTGRYALANGSFTYIMKVAKDCDNVLEVTFKKADNGKSIKISVGDNVVYNETLNNDGESDYYTVRIPVSKAVISDAAYQKDVSEDARAVVMADVVNVKIESGNANDSASVCNYLYMTKAYGTDTSLELKASAGTLVTDGNTLSLSLDSDVTSVALTSKLASEYGYIRVNGNVARTEVPYTVDLGKANFATLTYTVYAEDHETTEEYTLNITKALDADSRTDVDKNLTYFVNCGDYDVTTLSDGDLFGTNNGVTDQAYGRDPITGYYWGIVDTLSNPLKNGTVTNNAAMTNAVFTDNTWPFETGAGVTDASPKTETNRYTKNQFESGIDRNLNYDFQVENGTYTVALYFVDPWGCSKNPIVSAEGNVLLENVEVKQEVTAEVEVTDGKLSLNITSPDETLCLNLAYIKISQPAEAENLEGETTTGNKQENETDKEEETTVAVEDESKESGSESEIEGPETGDKVNPMLYIIMLLAGLAGIGMFAADSIKRRRITNK